MGIYDDLIPKEAPKQPEKKPGLLKRVTNFFTGKKEEPAKPVAPAPAPIREDSRFKDLVPVNGVVPAQKTYGSYDDLVPKKEAAAAPEPEDSVLKKAYGAYKKQVERKSMSLFAGALEGGGGMVRSLELFGNRLLQKAPRPFGGKVRGETIKQGENRDDSLGLKTQELARRGAEIVRESAGITPENQTFSEKAVEGLGSSLPYFIPGAGIGRVAQAATAAPKLSFLFGNIAASSLEAMAEAGQVYDALRKEKGDEAAMHAADKTFLANAVLLTLTERLGIFNPNVKGLLKRALISMPTEGLQEAGQQIISNHETGRPLSEGVLEAGAIGAVVGGVLGPGVEIAGMKGGTVPSQIVDRPNAYADLVPEERRGELAAPATPEAPAERKRPETTEQAFSEYASKLAEEKKDGGPVVIGADDMKDYFGKDYDETRHEIYSKAAFKLFETEVQNNPDKDTVVLTGAGPGSGKTETLVNVLRSNKVPAIVYDSNLANIEGAKKQIELARKSGKKVEIHGILPNIDMAKKFVASRPRSVSAAAFARGHARFPRVVQQLLEEGLVKSDEVAILDARAARTYEEAITLLKQRSFVKDPLAAVRSAVYNEEEIRNAYEQDLRNIQESGGREDVREPSRGDRTDTENERGGKGADTRQALSPAERKSRVAELTQKVRDAYKAVGDKVDQAFFEVRAELELSEAGYRTAIGDESGYTTEWIGVPSTFPKWIPEELRSKKLFETVMGGLQNADSLTFPPANAPRRLRLYNLLLDEVDKAAGVDTSAFRNEITSLYERRKEEGARGSDSGRARGGEGTQRERVEQVVAEGPKSVKEVADETGILEPNVRRILGVGAKEGIFERVDKGVYVLKKDGKDLVYVHTGDAVETLPKLAAEGFQADMVFLDIPYATKAVRGGNRGVKYDLISPAEFSRVLRSVKRIVRDTETPVVHMFSQAESGKSEMSLYNEQFLTHGFKPVGRGAYTKYQKDGVTRVRNMRGNVIEPEGIIVFSLSGEVKKPLEDMDFHYIRPKGYQTEKPEEMLAKIVEMTTAPGGMVLDPFAGSGVTGAAAVKKGRRATLIEKKEEVVEEVIKPRLEEAAKKKEPPTPSGTGRAFADADTPGGTPMFPVLKGSAAEKHIHPLEMPELVDLARELSGRVPDVVRKTGNALGRFYSSDKRIKIIAEVFKEGNLNDAVSTLAHEIGHLVDYLPDNTLKRGNLLGRLNTLRGFLRETFSEGPVNLKNSEIKKELLAVTRYWSPYDPEKVPESYRKYRESSKELYAEALSMLLNSPGLLEQMAPKFYGQFFNALDKKPAVKEAFFGIQALMSGDRAALIEHRRKGVQQMFKEGDIKSVDLLNQKEAERDARRRDLTKALKYTLVDKNFPLIDRVRELQKKGTFINPDDNPIFYLEERNYLGGQIKAFVEDEIVPVYKALQDNDISWETFGEALFYDRIIAGDRSQQANPRGITPKAAEELRADLTARLSDKQNEVLETYAQSFRKAIKKTAEMAYDGGLYTEDLFKLTKENEAYVTYQVIEHIEDGVSSKVYKSIGTLKDITNPADASILKMIATIRAVERNKTVKASVDFLKQHFPEDIEDARTTFTGKAKTPLEPKDSDKRLIRVYEKGKVQGYYVDSYIGDSLENESVGQNRAILAAMEVIAYPNRILFRPLFIGFNLGFQAFNFVRDFRRFWKNIPDMTIGRAIALYAGPARRLARVRAFGPKAGGGPHWEQALHDLQKLEKDKVFSITFSDLLGGRFDEETQIEAILQNSGIDTFVQPRRNRFWAPFAAVLDFIQDMGSMIETLPKAAGYYHLSKGKALTAEDRSYIRRYLGSPDFFSSGFAKPITNELFLFSNAIAQGVRSDIEIATMPKTRAAYWWKTAKLDLLPKAIMLAAALGLWGDDLDDMFAGVSEYDMTNYTIIPLGRDENGKTIYLRIPHDETGRLVAGLFWKLISTTDPNNEKEIGTSLMDIFSFTGGQIPSVTPVVSTASVIGQYLSGVNPYDSFRGRNIISDEVFKAGGMRAHKEVAGWVFNNLGGGIFVRFTKEYHPKEESFPEAFFKLPVLGNIIGRFVRVSDYGKTERLQEIKKNVEGEEAGRRLDDNDVVNDAINRALEADAASRTELRPYELEIVATVFPDRPRTSDEVARARRLINKFRLGITRGKGDPLINALIDAQSNAQKAALIKDIRADMTDEEYRAFKKEAIQSDAASGEAFQLAEKK